jgi:hypothetical protein
MIELTEQEQIAKHYAACMDSVNLINGGKPELMEDAEWADTVARNKEHLNIMLAKDFWTTENLAPMQTAVSE